MNPDIDQNYYKKDGIESFLTSMAVSLLILMMVGLAFWLAWKVCKFFFLLIKRDCVDDINYLDKYAVALRDEHSSYSTHHYSRERGYTRRSTDSGESRLSSRNEQSDKYALALRDEHSSYSTHHYSRERGYTRCSADSGESRLSSGNEQSA